MAARKTLMLALQGGGSHGALTWGVLDRFLADDRLAFSAISGTSAGAMNAVVMADGLQKGGPDGARAALERFWRAVSDAARLSPIQRSIWQRLSGDFGLDRSPAFLWFEQLTRAFSPYELNLMDINPLRDLVATMIDFDCVNHSTGPRIFVTATNVRTGRARIFAQPDLSVDTLMASACLPTMFRAVEIGGEHYWDGGYIGNPALQPLVDHVGCRDIVVVQINPMVREGPPRTAREILNRINEITFNASLVKDLRAIQLLHRAIDAEGLEAERHRDMRLHLLHTDEQVQDLDPSSKMNAEWPFLTHLRDFGRAWAHTWLDANFDALENRSSFDLDVHFADTFASRQIAEHPPGVGVSAA